MSFKLVVAALLLTNISGIFISKQVDVGQELCLNEDLPKHTLIKIDLKTTGNFHFQFKEGMMPVLSDQIYSMGYTKSVTTQRYGTHHFCFLNQGRTPSKISMQIAIGKHANDFGSAVGGQDLIGSLANQALIAQEFIQDIVKENTEGLEIMVAEAREKFTFTNLYVFSGIFVLFSLLLTYLQYSLIKKYLHARKYI